MSRTVHVLRAWSQFTKEACRYRRWMVLTDYDGTLTPIVANPDRARLSHATKQILGRLSRLPHVRVGVISGRALPELKRLVGLPGLMYAGNHGFEASGPAGRFVHPRVARYRPVMRRIAQRLRGALRGVPGVRVESKGASLSIHWRGVPRSAHRRFQRIVTQETAPLQRQGAVRVTRGKRVVEVRPPVAWDKGRVIAWLVQRAYQASATRSPKTRSHTGAGSAWIVYLGDDRTDEDGFRVVNRFGGASIFVGHRAGHTRATWRLKDPREVRICFSRLLQAVTRAAPTR